MAKTLILGEKDEDTFVAKTEFYLDGPVGLYRDYVLGMREEGFAPIYAAFMVMQAKAAIDAWKRSIQERHV